MPKLDSKPTLVYFDIKGRAEVTRLIFHAAGQEFEDKRVSGESWQAYKPKTPFGQLPILEMNGKMYSQSHAFNRYLADELGLGGKTRLESLQADQVANLWEDMIKKCAKGFFEKDEAKKAEIIKEVKEGFCVQALQYLENMLKENGTGYLVGSGLTVADIYVFDMITGTMIDYIAPLDNFPLVKALVEKVKSNPGITSYVAARK